MTNQVSVLVVYVNYLGSVDIVRSINSLKINCPRSLDIIVVDNSPEDDCASIRAEFSDVKVVRSHKNLGFAGGCNLGIASADRPWDFVLLLNPDTYCETDFLSPLLEVAQSDPAWGILSPKIYKAPPDGGIWFSGSTLKWWRGGSRHVYDDRFSNKSDVAEVPFVSGCCSLISAAAWSAAGPMDDSLFLYFEDNDLVERVKQVGAKIGYVPEVSIIHNESSSTGYQSAMFLYYFSRNRLLILQRWAPVRARLIYYAIHFLIKIPGAWIIFGLIQGSPRRAKAFTSGAIDGLKGRAGPNWRWHSKPIVGMATPRLHNKD